MIIIIQSRQGRRASTRRVTPGAGMLVVGSDFEDGKMQIRQFAKVTINGVREWPT